MIELDGEWEGFEDHLAQAEPAPLVLTPPPVADEPPPDRTYEQHLVLGDF